MSDPYRRLARLLARQQRAKERDPIEASTTTAQSPAQSMTTTSEQRAKEQTMRSHLKVRAASVTMAALKAGYRREPEGDDQALNVIAWRRERGALILTGNPETLPAPLRFAARAVLIAAFAGACRLCGAQARLLTDEQLAAIDAGRLQVVTRHRLHDGVGSADPAHFAIEHAAACPCAPEHIERMAAAGAN